MLELVYMEYLVIVLVFALLVSVYINFKLSLKLRADNSKTLTLIKKAYYNPVTSLPNLTNVQLVIDEHISKSARHKKPFLLVVLKIINYYDVQAHSEEYADLMMIEAGKKLKATLRTEDIIAHTTENGFVILFNEYLEKKNHDILFTRLREAFKGKVVINDRTSYEFKISIGTAEFSENLATSEQLIKEATRQALA